MNTDYKADLVEANEHRPNCDQCGKPAVALLNDWPVCGEHWAQFRRRAYAPVGDQSPTTLDARDIMGALAAGAVRGRTAADVLERIER